VSTLDALLREVFGASMTIGELRRHGDFGLGTYVSAVNQSGHYFHFLSDNERSF
jgi:alpha-acetolactate decarboxylase